MQGDPINLSQKIVGKNWSDTINNSVLRSCFLIGLTFCMWIVSGVPSWYLHFPRLCAASWIGCQWQRHQWTLVQQHTLQKGHMLSDSSVGPSVPLCIWGTEIRDNNVNIILASQFHLHLYAVKTHHTMLVWIHKSIKSCLRIWKWDFLPFFSTLLEFLQL